MANLTGVRSTFPASIDDILELYTLPASQKTNALRYQELIMKTSLTQAESDELAGLIAILQNYIIDVEKWNKFGDILINMQNFFKNETEGYIENKKLEFDAELNKFTYMGIYNNTATYNKWNVVTYGGRSYLSLVENNLNSTPPTSPANWALIAERGEQGVPGIGLSFRGDYNAATTYQIQDAVNFNGVIYYCIQPGTNKTPDASPAYWQVFMESTKITVGPTKPTGGWWFEEIV